MQAFAIDVQGQLRRGADSLGPQPVLRTLAPADEEYSEQVRASPSSSPHGSQHWQPGLS